MQILPQLKKHNFIHKLVLVCCALWAPVLLFSYKLSFIPFFLMAMGTIPVHRFKSFTKDHFPFLSLTGGIAIWSCLSALWSYDRTLALVEVSKIVVLIVGFLSMFCYFKMRTRDQMAQIIKSFMVGVGITAYCMVLDLFMGFKLAIYRNPILPKTYSYGLISLIFGYWLSLSSWAQQIPSLLREKRAYFYGTAFALFLLLFAFSFHYDYDAGPLAFLLGGIIFLLVSLFPIVMPRIIRYGLILTFLSAPVLISQVLTPSFFEKMVAMKMPHTHRQRLELLEWGNHFIYESPILGQGFAQTKMLEHHASRPRDYGNEFKGVNNGDWGMVAWHMHNGLMQVWVELGLIGALFVAALLWVFLRHMESFEVPPVHRALFYGFLLSFFFIFSISFGIWQTWWFLTIGLMFILNLWNFKIIENKDIEFE